MQVGEGLTQCYWLEPTGQVAVYLRRFTFSVPETDKEGERPGHRNCPASAWGHDASTGEIARTKVRMRTEPDGYQVMLMVAKRLWPSRADPVWPQVCAACGEPFRKDDQWQVNQAELYTRADTGAEVEIRSHPGPEHAGALFDSWWRHGYAGGMYVGSDGVALAAVCPNGMQWEVDGEATGGGHWTRTGDPRRPETLSVTPSIAAGTAGTEGYYHGFLGSNGTPPGWFSAHLG